VYNDRMCRKSNGAADIAISEQDINSCWRSGSFYTSPAADGTTQITKPAGTWPAEDGCDGGSPTTAWVLMTTEGRVSRWADPYTAKGGIVGPETPSNPDTCGSVDPASLKYKVMSDAKGARVFTIPKGNAGLIKQAIYSGGSVNSGFTVFACIMQYRGGAIYTRTSAEQQGGHAVAVIGYGTDAGTPYWIFANSWGEVTTPLPTHTPTHARGAHTPRLCLTIEHLSSQARDSWSMPAYTLRHHRPRAGLGRQGVRPHRHVDQRRWLRGPHVLP
jgi:cathepsin B